MKRLMLLLALLATFLALVGSVSAVGMTVSNFRYSDAVNPDDRYYAVDVAVSGTGVKESGLVEIDLINANLPPPPLLAFFGGLDNCDSTFPYNIHRTYGVGNLGGYDSTKFTLTGRNIPDGTYNAVLVHYTGCAKDGGVQKDPNKWLVLKDRIVFGSASGNIADQCDNDYEAGLYLKSKGVLNCRVAQCVDPASSSSKAVCAVSGECNNGAVQAQTCLDGSTVDVRICSNNNWVSTGSTCLGQPPPIVPPPVVPPKTPVNLMGWVVIAGAAVGGFFVLRRFGLVRF